MLKAEKISGGVGRHEQEVDGQKEFVKFSPQGSDQGWMLQERGVVGHRAPAQQLLCVTAFNTVPPPAFFCVAPVQRGRAWLQHLRPTHPRHRAGDPRPVSG